MPPHILYLLETNRTSLHPIRMSELFMLRIFSSISELLVAPRHLAKIALQIQVLRVFVVFVVGAGFADLAADFAGHLFDRFDAAVGVTFVLGDLVAGDEEEMAFVAGDVLEAQVALKFLN
jgi:hypothetical protein